jgi:hypothetical protein
VSGSLLESLDYLYLPAPDLDASFRFYQDILRGEPRWRIRHGKTWVVALRFAGPGPLVLLADHLELGQSLLIYRTGSLKELSQRLAASGWSIEGEPFEIPAGPCLIVRDPGGQRLAFYERVRPEMDQVFEGRFDDNENVPGS